MRPYYEVGPGYIDNNGNVVAPSDAVTLCDLYIEKKCIGCPISASCDFAQAQ